MWFFVASISFDNVRSTLELLSLGQHQSNMTGRFLSSNAITSRHVVKWDLSHLSDFARPGGGRMRRGNHKLVPGVWRLLSPGKGMPNGLTPVRPPSIRKCIPGAPTGTSPAPLSRHDGCSSPLGLGPVPIGSPRRT